MSARAALYLRQSKLHDEGIERQRKRCTALAAAREWSVVTEFVDNDVSASKTRGVGTAWARMLDEATAGAFDVLIAVDLDRLLRRVDDLAPLTATGAKVLTVDGEIDLTTADGEFRATMLAGIARFEVRRKSERQQRANEARALKGHTSTARRPFGYAQDGMSLIDLEARAIRDGYSDLLAGVPLAEIARRWNARGLVTPQLRRGVHKDEPSPWRPDAVRFVLLNPRNMGKAVYRGEIVADSQGPAIVPEETWRAASSVLNNPARRSGKVAARHLLSGLALCGVCGTTVHGGGASRKGVRIYRCSSSHSHVGRMALPVEQYVAQVVVARLSQPDARDLLHDTERPDVDALRTEANGLRSRLDALAVDFADGDLTPSQLKAASERIRTRLAVLEGDLADAGRVNVLGPLLSSDDIAAAWAAAGTQGQRAIIDALMIVRLHGPGRGTRTFRPETVEIDWKQ